MKAARNISTGWQMRAYLALRLCLQPLVPLLLQRRLRQNKEDPLRMGEKLGKATQARPTGQLVWLHAVGLGEVLALRPIILQMQAAAPDLHFLITSTARSSAHVIGANLPPRCQHQFLPLDAPRFVKAFLQHWRPDLAIWSEQDLWPGAIVDCAAAGIPVAYINARISADSYRRRAWLRGLYRDVFARFSLIAAQDEATAAHLLALGSKPALVTGSLKPAAEPLAADPDDLADMRKALHGRKVWVAASTHAADEGEVIAAQARLTTIDPAWLLILTPRLPNRTEALCAALDAAGLTHVQRSDGRLPQQDTSVWLADSFGELGLWYRLAQVAFVGASFGGLGGHNPWEALCLSVPVIHGPDTQNFSDDYALLDAKGLAKKIAQGALADAVATTAAEVAGPKADALIASARAALGPLAQDLLELMEDRT
ncbi:MAG: 3-deoxy-D-manno-octulosonic-acid transferase [Pseudorhodobacter sp.]|jgi:3-deoxy-D-manno-octulosonic-acid transferase